MKHPRTLKLESHWIGIAETNALKIIVYDLMQFNYEIAPSHWEQR